MYSNCMYVYLEIVLKSLTFFECFLLDQLTDLSLNLSLNIREMSLTVI